MPIRRLLGRLAADEGVLAISRRYFISNGFDGTLTCVGTVVGAVLSGVPDGGTVIASWLGAAVGLGVGVLCAFGAYMGFISRQRWYVGAARMGFAGLVVAAINLVLPG